MFLPAGPFFRVLQIKCLSKCPYFQNLPCPEIFLVTCPEKFLVYVQHIWRTINIIVRVSKTMLSTTVAVLTE